MECPELHDYTVTETDAIEYADAVALMRNVISQVLEIQHKAEPMRCQILGPVKRDPRLQAILRDPRYQFGS